MIEAHKQPKFIMCPKLSNHNEAIIKHSLPNVLQVETLIIESLMFKSLIESIRDAMNYKMI